MNTGQKVALGSVAVAVVAVGIELAYLHHERNEDAKPKVVETAPIDPDYNVFLKKERPDKLEDEKALKGRTLWISTGGQLDYYPYKAGKVDYAKTSGTLLGAEPIVAQDAVEAVAPKTATFRIPAGDKQVLLVFTKPGSTDEYAVPVGNREKGVYTFQSDLIFFYDDPHKLYSFWGPEVWKAIDEHKAILGMTEHEVQMALGQVATSGGQEEGNRTVEYNNLGHPIRVTFVKNKATSIEPE